jgi:nickel-type superoxide dismutase maturation protease
MSIWPLGLYRVAGDSMLPTYRPGDTLLGLRWFTPRPGQVVVAVESGRPLVKRIIAIEASAVTLAGDNPAASTDSRHFGPVHKNQLEAKILVKI